MPFLIGPFFAARANRRRAASCFAVGFLHLLFEVELVDRRRREVVAFFFGDDLALLFARRPTAPPSNVSDGRW